MAVRENRNKRMISNHENYYKPEAWRNLSMRDLGEWVHLLTQRAAQRDSAEKKEKDLYDAQNYLDMMQLKLSGMQK